MNAILPLLFLIAATTFEAVGDAVIRKALGQDSTLLRTGLFAFGAILLFAYGLLLNLAPLDFGRVVGLYIATLFIVWQIVNYFAFQALPSWPVIIGGILIVTGGCIASFWKTA